MGDKERQSTKLQLPNKQGQNKHIRSVLPSNNDILVDSSMTLAPYTASRSYAALLLSSI
jgi:hypothetical protein